MKIKVGVVYIGRGEWTDPPTWYTFIKGSGWFAQVSYHTNKDDAIKKAKLIVDDINSLECEYVGESDPFRARRD